MEKEMMLQELIERKIAQIKDYDKSEGVNSFALNDNLVWLDKATRVGLVNSLNIEKAAGRTDTELWLNGQPYKLPIDTVLQMLVVVELYAIECYNVTEQHIANVKALTDINRVWNYRYTKGYPERPRFEV
jgi:hypothetical protein